MERRRIGDDDLEYLENVIAAQNGIIRRCQLLVLLTDDLDVLESLEEVVMLADKTKDRHIKLMEKIRGEL
jgi:hypothetical protein